MDIAHNGWRRRRMEVANQGEEGGGGIMNYLPWIGPSSHEWSIQHRNGLATLVGPYIIPNSPL